MKKRGCEKRGSGLLCRTRSTIEGGGGCNKFVPVVRRNGTKIAPTGDIFDQPPGGMSWIRGKHANHVGVNAVLSPEEGVLVTYAGTESSYPRPLQLLNNLQVELKACRDKLDWLIIRHNCAAYTFPEEEYPPRHLTHSSRLHRHFAE